MICTISIIWGGVIALLGLIFHEFNIQPHTDTTFLMGSGIIIQNVVIFSYFLTRHSNKNKKRKK